MRKRWAMTVIVTLMLLLSACKTGQEPGFSEVLSAEQGLFRYEGTEEADTIAVDEEGLLYTVSYIPRESRETYLETEYVYQPATQRFQVYDLEGNLILERDVEFGDAGVRVMLEEQGKLYCVVGKSVRYTNVPYLYAVDIATWEVEELCELKGYSNYVTQIVHIGEYFYLCGRLEYPLAKSYDLHPDVYSYTYQGEAVYRVNPAAEQPQMERIPVDFPISIFRTAKDTLMVYHYAEEYGFGLLEFSADGQALTEAKHKPASVANAHFTMCEDGYLFWEQGSLYYGTAEGAGAELTSEQISIWKSLVYRKGFAFYGNGYADQIVERICVASLLKENRTIHLLMHTDMMGQPFGCGYRMERTELPTEQYALKVLAQDSDFDVLVLSTRNSSAYNLKENGAFYALNEVEGVEEYLDACFPYIKELATNGDGDIWMLPVQLAIPALFYDKEYCERMGVSLSAMDFMDFLLFTEQERSMERKGQEMVSISTYVIEEELFGQYLQRWDSFDTQPFRNYLRKIKEIMDRSDEWHFNNVLYSAVGNGEREDFFYSYEVYQANYLGLIQKADALEGVGVMGVPKLEEGIGNVGTLTFLAVNPQAENLEAALDYISSFAKYMLGQKDTLLLANEATYTDTPVMHDLYRLYADGVVRFAMEPSIFDDQYWAYLSGEISLEEMIEESERRRKIYMGE